MIHGYADSGAGGYWFSLTKVVHGYEDPERGGYWFSPILWFTVMPTPAAGVLVLAYPAPYKFPFSPRAVPGDGSRSPGPRLHSTGSSLTRRWVAGVLVLAYTALGSRLPGDGSRGHWFSLTQRWVLAYAAMGRGDSGPRLLSTQRWVLAYTALLRGTGARLLVLRTSTENGGSRWRRTTVTPTRSEGLPD